MGETLGLNGNAQPAYEAPERIGHVILASEAEGSSSSGNDDANSQYYWGSDGDEVLGGVDGGYEAPEVITSEVPAEDAQGSTSSGNKDANSQYYL